MTLGFLPQMFEGVWFFFGFQFRDPCGFERELFGSSEAHKGDYPGKPE